MDQALERLRYYRDDSEKQIWRPRFERVARMPGANRLFNHINQLNRRGANPSDEQREQLADHLAAIDYALVFAGLGFEVRWEPSGDKGPDLEVSRDNQTLVVEVTRLRQRMQSRRQLCTELKPITPADWDDPTLMLEEYGDIETESSEVLNKIKKKFAQLGGKPGAIAIWDDSGADDISADYARQWLGEEVKAEVSSLPGGLLFVIYHASIEWIHPGLQGWQDLYCYPLRPLDKIRQAWSEEMEGTTLRQLIERALLNKFQAQPE